MSENNETTPDTVEHELIIKFMFSIPRKYTLKKFEFPLQNHPFKYGLLIKNKKNIVFPGATLKDFTITSIPDQLKDTTKKEFSIHSLNPDEEIEIWFGQTTTFVQGSIWIDCKIVPNEKHEIIHTYQIDKHEQISPYEKINEWGNNYFIQGLYEFQQARTNMLIAILTLITLLEGIFGLKNIFINILILLQEIFLYFADLIEKLL